MHQNGTRQTAFPALLFLYHFYWSSPFSTIQHLSNSIHNHSQSRHIFYKAAICLALLKI